MNLMRGMSGRTAIAARGIPITIAAISAAALLLSGCESSKSNNTAAAAPSGGSLTLNATLNQTALPASVAIGGKGRPLSVDPTGLALNCETYTSSPASGKGQFDSAGHVSLSIAGAAGQPVGCTLVGASGGSLVTPLVFALNAAQGMASGISAMAALNAGSYALPITYYPDAQLAQSIDLSQVAATTSAQFDPAALAGNWLATCLAPVVPQCLGPDGSPNVTMFLDVVKATGNGQTLYAMGQWPNVNVFVAAGKTEMVELPAGMTAVSLVPASLVAGIDPTAAFVGLTSDPAYDRATNTMPATSIWSFLAANSTALYGTLGDFTMPTVGTCQTNANFGSPFDGSRLARYCLMEYLEGGAKSFPSLGIPTVDPGAWDDFLGAPGATSTATTLAFKTAFGSVDANVSRRSWSGLQLMGETAVATSYWLQMGKHCLDSSGTWSLGVEGGTLSFVIVMTSAGTASAEVTTKQFSQCGTADAASVQSVTFDGSLTKQ